MGLLIREPDGDDRQMAVSLTTLTWAAPPKLGVGKGRGSAGDKRINRQQLRTGKGGGG